MSASRIREVAARVGLVLGGVLAALLLLEGLLRAGALVVRFVPSRIAVGKDAAPGRRLLALGDSNTWGLWVKAKQAYPKQVEFLWNEEGDRPPLEVINLGYPGMNSSGVRQRLPQLLRTFRPDVVTVMIGVNDYWTAPEKDDDGDVWTRLDMRLWQWSRVYRLAAMIGRGFAVPEVDAPRDGFGKPSGPLTVALGGERFTMPRYRIEQAARWVERLEANLAAIADLVRGSGARLVFLTYPSDLPLSPVYGEANRALRESAAKLDVPLVEIASRLTPRCPALPCKDLKNDHHASREGHRRAARIIVAELTADLPDAQAAAPAASPSR